MCHGHSKKHWGFTQYIRESWLFLPGYEELCHCREWNGRLCSMFMDPEQISVVPDLNFRICEKIFSDWMYPRILFNSDIELNTSTPFVYLLNLSKINLDVLMVCIWVITAHTPEEYLACWWFLILKWGEGNVKFLPRTKTRSNFSFRASCQWNKHKGTIARPGPSVPSSGPEVSESVVAGSRAMKWHPVQLFDNMCRRMKCEVVKMHPLICGFTEEQVWCFSS